MCQETPERQDHSGGVGLLGAITPDSGTVDVLGHRLPAGRSAAMEGVGFAAGYLPLPDRLRVREVLTVFANLHGVAEPGAAIDAGLERFRIPQLAEAMATELWLLPSTHAVEAARRLLDGDPMPWDLIARSAAGLAAVLPVSLWTLWRMLGLFRARGYVTRYS